MQIMTVLEANVAADKWATLKVRYAELEQGGLPSQMVESMLVQSEEDPHRWQGISIWHSREALIEYRKSVETPGGILLFRSVGAEPRLEIMHVEHRQQRR